MKRYININYVRASNLILVSAALGLINYLLSGGFTVSAESGIALFAILVLFVTALLVRKGFVWAKWVYSVLVILGLLVTILVILPDGLHLKSLSDYISDLQLIIQVIAVIILFIPSKQPPIDASVQSDII